MMNIYSEIKDFVVDIGIEVLKEKGGVVYNERIIKDELIDYTNRELVNFENIDKECEIDFENLKIYVINELIDDFRDSLYGDIDKRKKKKESMVESLYSYVQANSNKKKKYVESIFLKAFAIIENYYETHIVKPENLYLANKVVDNIHKDIQQCLEAVNSLADDNSYIQDKQFSISMVQYGNKNQQMGQVTSLIINND